MCAKVFDARTSFVVCSKKQFGAQAQQFMPFHSVKKPMRKTRVFRGVVGFAATTGGILTACLCAHAPVLLPAAVVVASLGFLLMGTTVWQQKPQTSANHLPAHATLPTHTPCTKEAMTQLMREVHTIFIVTSSAWFVEQAAAAAAATQVHAFASIAQFRQHVSAAPRCVHTPHTLVFLDTVLMDGDGRDFCVELRTAFAATCRIIAIVSPASQAQAHMQSLAHLVQLGFNGTVLRTPMLHPLPLPRPSPPSPPSPLHGSGTSPQ